MRIGYLLAVGLIAAGSGCDQRPDKDRRVPLDKNERGGAVQEQTPQEQRSTDQGRDQQQLEQQQAPEQQPPQQQQDGSKKQMTPKERKEREGGAQNSDPGAAAGGLAAGAVVGEGLSQIEKSQSPDLTEWDRAKLVRQNEAKSKQNLLCSSTRHGHPAFLRSDMEYSAFGVDCQGDIPRSFTVDVGLPTDAHSKGRRAIASDGCSGKTFSHALWLRNDIAYGILRRDCQGDLPREELRGSSPENGEEED